MQLFNAHVALREILLGHRNRRVPFNPVQAFGIPLLSDAKPIPEPPIKCPN